MRRDAEENSRGVGGWRRVKSSEVEVFLVKRAISTSVFTQRQRGSEIQNGTEKVLTQKEILLNGKARVITSALRILGLTATEVDAFLQGAFYNAVRPSLTVRNLTYPLPYFE